MKFGFCRGLEPVNYVSHILERFEHYKQFVVAKSAATLERLSVRLDIKTRGGSEQLLFLSPKRAISADSPAISQPFTKVTDLADMIRVMKSKECDGREA